MVVEVDLERVSPAVDQDRPEGPTGLGDGHDCAPMGGRGTGGSGLDEGDGTEHDQCDHGTRSSRDVPSGSCVLGITGRGPVLTFSATFGVITEQDAKRITEPGI